MRLLFLSCLAAVTAAAASPASFELDRCAILAMAGDFEVTFQFEETVPVLAGYELHEPYLERATETVLLVSDEGTRIVLQHLLLSDAGRVIKHWKQEWNYEDPDISAFKGDNTWVTERVPDDRLGGSWSQRVSRVDDSPRYESYGKWERAGGFSSWTSAPTHRPLPRREYSE